MSLDWNEAFDAFRAGEPAWFGNRRQAALNRFTELGLPTRKHEEWRYTPLRDVEAVDWKHTAVPTPLPAGDLGFTTPVLVFVDGLLDAAASNLDGLPEGVTVRTVRELLASGDEVLERYLGTAAFPDERAIVALNLAFLTDGVVVQVAPNVEVGTPIHLVFIGDSAADAHALHVRNLIIAGHHSKVTVIEHWRSSGGPKLTTAVTEVFTDDGAIVHHGKLGLDGDDTLHLGSVDVNAGRDARVTHHSLLAGGKLSRTEVRAKLSAPGADCGLYGLTLGRDRQLLDTLTFVDHASTNGTSAQVFKSILDDKSTGVFNGMVLVRADATGNDATQSNKNLVLTEGASAHTRPQLEIHNDDVKCSHGATVGALDPEQLFFLRSRGIPEADARLMLTAAFAHDVLETVPDADLRAAIGVVMQEWMS